ncbi:MAG: hypothetical protein A2132_06430 [Nitrospirae bacterium RBG_16_43_11]|nr:MAG: hypothetical protein A2132_06430 [Nitrospirae bacterium RBG_16_43_11]
MISVIVFVPMMSDILKGIFKIRTKFALLLLSVCFMTVTVISGCAGKAVLSDDAVRIRNTVDIISQLKVLYEGHDEGILALFSTDYLSESGMKDSIVQDMKRFSALSLNIFIDRMEVDKDVVSVSVHWNASRGDGEKTFKDGGSSVIIIQSGDGLKIVGIKGDSPFGISNK